MIIGSVIQWTTEEIPEGYLICDGAAVNRDTYKDLFEVLGVIYGDGDGSTTFNVPDLRGHFLRCSGLGSGFDPDRNSRTDRGDGQGGNWVGTRQGNQIKSHRHFYYPHFFQWFAPQRWIGGASQANANTYGSGGSETRPKNITVAGLIKY